MRKLLFALALFMTLALSPFAQQGQAWVRVGIRVPIYGPGYGYGYYGYGYPYYYPPAPIVVSPPPVVYQTPPPVVVGSPPPGPSEPLQPPLPQQQPFPRTAPLIQSSAPAPLPNVSNVIPVSTPASPQVNALVQDLSQPSDTARRDAALQLGRMKASSAVDALANVLTKDSSPVAREGAARALGLIGSPTGLKALIYAAQADDDREVRHSAQFAVEVIRSSLRGN